MDITKVSLGSKKNIKKEINVEVTKRHMIGAFLLLMLFVALVHYIIILFFAPVQNLELICDNGEKVQIEYQKEFYCGDHYTPLEGSISDKSYNNIKRQIQVGDLYDE